MSVVLIGAGIAGLTCATYLQQRGIDVLLLEAGDGVGGRVRTDELAGFRLDRGFQILLTAYPEAERLLDYGALDLKAFRSGALIHHERDNEWMALLNPFKEPQRVLTTLTAPFGTLADKLRIVELLRRVQGMSTADFFAQDATTTLAYLDEMGFSERIITRFFRPFFGGVFLEDALTTSSNFFEFCFKMFFLGDAAVPALGIGQIAQQLAARLPAAGIRLNCPVERVSGNRVQLASGETLTAEAVVLAVDADQATRLLGQPPLPETAFNHTVCTYFSAPASPLPRKLLMLNPKRSSAIHNMAVMSDVAPAYAPAGRSLISVSTQNLEVVHLDALTERVARELVRWFGDDARHWTHLRSYHLPHALPAYGPSAVHLPLQLSDTLFQCGDRTAYPSLNAAMQTGRLVAEKLAETLR